MDADERLRVDYDQTTEMIRALMDVRFKLLAVVPTIAGAAVAFLGSRESAPELLGVGLLGLVATAGILLYDLQNTEVFDAMVRHAQALERLLGIQPPEGASRQDGALSQFGPRAHGRLFGIVSIGQDRALALVYGAALGGWSYLVVWGALRALDVAGARTVGAVVGAIATVLVIFEVERFGTEAAKPRSATASGNH
jgi:hypothetical protein